MTTNAWDDLIEKRHGKQEGSATVAATALFEESESAMRARIASLEAQRVKDVTAACDLAGSSARTAAFLASGKTVGEVLAVLAAERTWASKRAQRASA